MILRYHQGDHDEHGYHKVPCLLLDGKTYCLFTQLFLLPKLLCMKESAAQVVHPQWRP